MSTGDREPPPGDPDRETSDYEPLPVEQAREAFYPPPPSGPVYESPTDEPAPSTEDVIALYRTQYTWESARGSLNGVAPTILLGTSPTILDRAQLHMLAATAHEPAPSYAGSWALWWTSFTALVIGIPSVTVITWNDPPLEPPSMLVAGAAAVFVSGVALTRWRGALIAESRHRTQIYLMRSGIGEIAPHSLE